MRHKQVPKDKVVKSLTFCTDENVGKRNAVVAFLQEQQDVGNTFLCWLNGKEFNYNQGEFLTETKYLRDLISQELGIKIKSHNFQPIITNAHTIMLQKYRAIAKAHKFSSPELNYLKNFFTKFDTIEEAIAKLKKPKPFHHQVLQYWQDHKEDATRIITEIVLAKANETVPCITELSTRLDSRQCSLEKAVNMKGKNSYELWFKVEINRPVSEETKLRYPDYTGEYEPIYIPIKVSRCYHKKVMKQYLLATSYTLRYDPVYQRIEIIGSYQADKIIVDAPVLKEKSLGGDVGLTFPAAFSDGYAVGKNEFLQKSLSQHNAYSARVSRRKSLGTYHSPTNKDLRANRRVRNQVRNFIRMTAKRVVRDHPEIQTYVFENLTISDQSSGFGRKFNRRLRQMMVQGSLREFESVIKGYGLNFFQVSSFYTSRLCGKCWSFDAKNRKGLKFKCVSCGFEAHADVNAAVNILERIFDVDLLAADKATIVELLKKRHEGWQGHRNSAEDAVQKEKQVRLPSRESSGTKATKVNKLKVVTDSIPETTEKSKLIFYAA